MKHNLLTTTTIAMLLASSAYAQETIKIGVLTPLSGTYAGIGQQVRWGIDQSVEEGAVCHFLHLWLEVTLI